MPRFRKKPVVIDAIKNEGEWSSVIQWLQDLAGAELIFQPGEEPPMTRNEDGSINIATPEGTMRANVDDWIIRGIKGEFYPCKPDIFEATYDPVVE